MKAEHPGIRIMRGRKIAATMVKDPLLPDWHPLSGRWTIHSVSGTRAKSHAGPIVANDGVQRRRDSGNVIFLFDDKVVKNLPVTDSEIDRWASVVPMRPWREVLPHVRVRFELPGLPPFRAEKLWPKLDQLWAAGIRDVDGHTLSRVL